MAQINFNPAFQSLSPTRLIAAPTRVSTDAKLVRLAAIIIFSAFIYSAFSKIRNPTHPPCNIDSKKKREIKLLKEGMKEYQKVATQEERVQIREFDRKEMLSQDLLTRLGNFVAQLRYKYPGVKLDEKIKILSNPAYGVLLKKYQEANIAAIEESKRVDNAKALQKINKEKMGKDLTLLLTEMDDFTLGFEGLSESIKPLLRCWAIFRVQARSGGLDDKKGIAEQFSQTEAHLKYNDSLNLVVVPPNIYKDSVQEFSNCSMISEEQSAQLRKSYEAYTDSISTIYESLAWIRLKKHLKEVGENCFREDFSTKFLDKIYKDGS